MADNIAGDIGELTADAVAPDVAVALDEVPGETGRRSVGTLLGNR